jgi:ssDNA-binding replication factor A large subunit
MPISRLGDVPYGEVTVEGEIIKLWAPNSSAIQQVGLIEDESGRTKFTVWKKSRKTVVSEGENVRLCAAAKNWYEGQYSIALTRRSWIEFPERRRWWQE